VLQVQKNWLTLSEQLETSTTSSHTEEEATSEATRIHPSVVHEIMFVEPYDMSQAMEDVFVEFRVLIDADGSLAVAGLKRHALSKGLGMEAPSLVAIISSTNLFVSSNSCNPTVKMNNNYVRHDAGIERLT
jgi:threonine dehydratase